MPIYHLAKRNVPGAYGYLQAAVLGSVQDMPADVATDLLQVCEHAERMFEGRTGCPAWEGPALSPCHCVPRWGPNGQLLPRGNAL